MQNNKKVINNIISVLLVVALTATLLWGLTSVCQMKRPKYTYGSFFDKNENIDVFLMGSSRMINAIFPMQLWEDYGITSYNLGAHAALIPSTYWELENALCVRTPKLVVLDTYGISNNFKYETPEHLHSWMDVFPLNATKIKTIVDLNDDSFKKQAIADGLIDGSVLGGSSEFFWSFIKYHSRWDEINDEDFNTPMSAEKGAEARIRVEAFDGNKEDKNDTLSESYVGEEYLRRFITTCQNKGIEVLLVYLPSESEENHYAQLNRTKEIADEYGVNFLDLYDTQMIDPATDYYDAKHVNPLGTKKLTSCLGDFIANNYSIEDRRADENIGKRWEEYYKEYSYYRTELIEGSDSLDNILVQLSFDEFDSVIEIYNQDVLLDETICKLLAKLSVNAEDVKEAVNTYGACAVIINEGGKQATGCFVSDIPEQYLEKITQKCEDESYTGGYIGEATCNIRISVINTLNDVVSIKEL